MWYVNWSASDFTMDGSVRSLLHSDMVPPTSANTAYFVNEDFDKLLDEGLATADPDKQAEIYGEAQTIAWEALPVAVPLKRSNPLCIQILSLRRICISGRSI